MSYRKLLVIGLIVVVILGGIYFAVHKPQTTSRTNNLAAAAERRPASDFTVLTIDGQQFSLAAHKDKPVMLFAMFGGCGECIPVGQTLNQIQKDYAAQGLTVVAIDILKGEPTSVLEQYRNDSKVNFPLVSYDEAVVKSYGLTAPEITVIIDKNGNIAYKNQNALSLEQYKQQVERVL